MLSYILTPSDLPAEAIASAMARALVTVLHKEASR
jgi:hypothetical protein